MAAVAIVNGVVMINGSSQLRRQCRQVPSLGRISFRLT